VDAGAVRVGSVPSITDFPLEQSLSPDRASEAKVAVEAPVVQIDGATEKSKPEDEVVAKVESEAKTLARGCENAGRSASEEEDVDSAKGQARRPYSRTEKAKWAPLGAENPSPELASQENAGSAKGQLGGTCGGSARSPKARSPFGGVASSPLTTCSALASERGKNDGTMGDAPSQWSPVEAAVAGELLADDAMVKLVEQHRAHLPPPSERDVDALSAFN